MFVFGRRQNLGVSPIDWLVPSHLTSSQYYMINSIKCVFITNKDSSYKKVHAFEASSHDSGKDTTIVELMLSNAITLHCQAACNNFNAVIVPWRDGNSYLPTEDRKD